MQARVRKQLVLVTVMSVLIAPLLFAGQSPGLQRRQTPPILSIGPHGLLINVIFRMGNSQTSLVAPFRVRSDRSRLLLSTHP